MHKELPVILNQIGKDRNLIVIGDNISKIADVDDYLSTGFSSQIPPKIVRAAIDFKERKRLSGADNLLGLIISAVGEYEKWGLNRRGDGFLREDLLEGGGFGYLTYEQYGKIYWRHNKFGNGPIGKVTAADYQDDMGRVILFAVLDLNQAKARARDLYDTVMTQDVPIMTSMGVDPQYDICTYCGHIARRIVDHCIHVKRYLLRSDLPGPWVYEPPVGMINKKLRFKDISIVIDNAWRGSWVLDKVAEAKTFVQVPKKFASEKTSDVEDYEPKPREIPPIRRRVIIIRLAGPVKPIPAHRAFSLVERLSPFRRFMAHHIPLQCFLPENIPHVLNAMTVYRAPLTPTEFGAMLLGALGHAPEYRFIAPHPDIDLYDILELLMRFFRPEAGIDPLTAEAFAARSPHPLIIDHVLKNTWGLDKYAEDVYQPAPVQPVVPTNNGNGVVATPAQAITQGAASIGAGAALYALFHNLISKYIANPGVEHSLAKSVLRAGAGPLSIVAALPLAYIIGKAVAASSKPITGRMQFYQDYAVPPNPLLPQYSPQIYQEIRKEGSIPLAEIAAPFGVLTYSNYRILKKAQEGRPPSKIELTISGHPLETLFGTALLTHIGRKTIRAMLSRGPKRL